MFSSLRKALVKPTYRIGQDPEKGFLAMTRHPVTGGWYTIDYNGVLSVAEADARAHKSVWFRSESEAGEMINKHSASHNQKIVWQA